jgi:hypothetical protein
MKFTLGIALNPLDQLIELTRTAEECGFSSIALPDSIFFSQEVAADYPYTSDGRRFWTSEAPAGRGRGHRRGRGSVVCCTDRGLTRICGSRRTVCGGSPMKSSR